MKFPTPPGPDRPPPPGSHRFRPGPRGWSDPKPMGAADEFMLPASAVRLRERPGAAHYMVEGTFRMVLDQEGQPLAVVGRTTGKDLIIVPWHNVAELKLLEPPVEDHWFAYGSDSRDTQTCAHCGRPKDDHLQIKPEDRPIDPSAEGRPLGRLE